jgi:hypothetical protein
MNWNGGFPKARCHWPQATPTPIFRWLGCFGCLAQATLAVASGDLPLARTFDQTSVPINSPLLVTATLTNTTSATLRGFYYFDEVPTTLTVRTIRVSVNGQALTNFNFEIGLAGDLAPGCTAQRWWLETPITFPEANPIPPQGVVQILFTISSPTNGTFNLSQFGWAAAQGGTTNTLYGYSSSTEQQTVSFTNAPPVANAPPVLPPQSNRVIAQLSTLTVTNTATDPNGPADVLSYALLTPPSGAAIDPNGIITWRPTTGQLGLYTLTTVVTDSGVPPLSATNSFVVTVVTTNTPPPPTLPSLPDVTLTEGQLFIVTNTATTTRNAYQWVTNTFVFNYPNRASLTNDGWSFGATRPNGTTRSTESPDPAAATAISYDQVAHPGLLRLPCQWGDLWATANNSTNSLFRSPPTNWLSAKLNFNFAPTANYYQAHLALYQDDDNYVQVGMAWNTGSGGLGASMDRELAGTPSSVFQALTSSGNLTVRLDRNPTNNALTGFYSRDGTTWTTLTTLSQSLVNPRFAIWTGNGNTPPGPTPNLDLYRFEVVASNSAPVSLSYALLNAPANVAISTNGVITWATTEAQGPSTNVITTVVTDNGVPPASATNSFTVVVNELNQPPTLPFQSNRTLTGRQPLVVTNTASDPDVPSNTLSYWLAAPAGAAIDPNGLITWTPAVAQVPSTNLFITVVTDSNPWAVNSQHLSATNSFTVMVNATHYGPSLPVQTNFSATELTPLVVTNTALDTDVPVQDLHYLLLNPPAGATIDTNGIIVWTPTEAQGPSTNALTTVVTDTGTPPLSVTNSFTVIVNEFNTPPLLPVQSDRVIYANATLVVTNTATDSDLPVNTLSYQLDGPVGASIDTNGIITWTPLNQPGPSPQFVGLPPVTNTFTTIVTDLNPWAINASSLSATNSFMVVVQPLAPPPTILSLSLSNGLATLTWTASAGRSYRLQYTESLPATNWLAISPDITASDSTATASDAVGSSSQRFYRVLLLAP